MKDKATSKDRPTSINTMRSVLEGIGVDIEEVQEKRERLSLRDVIWNYPLYFSKIFKLFVPFSYIVVFLICGVLLSLFLQSEIFAKLFDNEGKKNIYTEGSVGAISSFNPLFLSNNYVDKAVEELVFERFVNIDKKGNPLPEIAVKWNVSNDRLTYDFEIASDIYWQTGEKLTVDDVIYTFETAISLHKDYGYDSVGAALSGLKIERTGEYSLKFVLSEVTPSFWEAISISIVPKMRLEAVDLEQMPFDMFAKYPIGSGKYKVTRTEQNAVFLQDNEYDKYFPTIKEIVLKIYPDKESLETAFRIGALDGLGGWDQELFTFLGEYSNVTKYVKREDFRVKNIFFNMRKEFLKRKELREAVTHLLDKEKLLTESGVGGYSLQGPYSENSWAFTEKYPTYQYDPAKAASLLKSVGYVKNPESGYYESKNQEILTLTLSYFESSTNERLVSLLVDLFEKEGVILKTEKLNYNQITQEIIATRDFELLLYEVEVTVDPDQYNLWHSLKSNYPDLNLSGYAYERVDILLEDGRKSFKQELRKEKYELFQKYLLADSPAIFLYNPSFVYFVKSDLVGLDIENIKYSYERFHNVHQWYWK